MPCFNSLIDNAVDLSFGMVGSFTTRAILREKTDSSYNPETHQVVSMDVPPKTIEVIIEESKLDFSYNTPTEVIKVMTKRKCLPEKMDLLDTLEINNRVFTVKSWESDPYMTTLYLV